MGSEPIHFIYPNATWAAYEASIEAGAYYLTQYPDYVVITRQDIDTDGILTALRAIPDVIEVPEADITAFKEANPSILPELL